MFFVGFLATYSTLKVMEPEIKIREIQIAFGYIRFTIAQDTCIN